jgi:tRNA modification GTPase
MYYGKIVDRGVLMDEVMCAVFRPPRSYTGEESAEIYAHGGATAVRGVLSSVLKNGARPALPGEFTRRAFLNGRMDLSQAEAVAEVIGAKTELAARVGLKRLGGGLSAKINVLRDVLLSMLANIGLSVDYPEHESEAENLNDIICKCSELILETEKLLDSYKTGRIITEGVRASIIGKPNAGKSTLLNAILKEERAIVTEIPGTTRDILTEPVSVGGVPFLFSDTAGLRETNDKIEMIGVSKTLENLTDSDLALWVIDRSVSPDTDDKNIIERLNGKNVIVLLNKTDLPESKGWADFLRGFPRIVPISAKTGEGLPALYDLIENEYLSGYFDAAGIGNEGEIIMNERHRHLLIYSYERLKSAVKAAEAGFAEDIVSIELTEAYKSFGEILGLEVGEDILDRIFSKFCVGK